VFGWLKRRWVCRAEHEAMRSSFETRIALLEAALAKYEGQLYSANNSPDNVTFALVDRLKLRARRGI